MTDYETLVNAVNVLRIVDMDMPVAVTEWGFKNGFTRKDLLHAEDLILAAAERLKEEEPCPSIQ